MPPKRVSIKEVPPVAPPVVNPPPVNGGKNGDGAAIESENEKPPPTFEQMWFDDPVEGREAQRLALELRKNLVLRAETMRIYLERTGIVALLLQGLQHMAKARPSNPPEWLAAFLLKNNPRKDMVIKPPVIVDPNAPLESKPIVEPVPEPIVQPKVDPKKKKK